MIKRVEEVFERFKKLMYKGFFCDKVFDSYKMGRWEEDLRIVKKDGDVIIVVLGYVYDVYDFFISMNVVKKFEVLNVNIKMFEMVF